MKNMSVVLFTILLAIAITSQGFQCASPEFSGAKLRMTQKDFKGAIELFEKEVQKNPGNEEAWYFLGILKADQDDYAGMNVAFDKALKINDKHVKEMRNARYSKWGQHVNNGISFLEKASSDSLQNYDKAIDHFNIAIGIWPDTALTYKYLGIAYNNKGDLDNALVSYRKAWDQGKDVEALSQVGKIYFVKGSELDTKFDNENADKLRVIKNMDEIKKGSHKNDVMAAFGAPDNVKKAPVPKPVKGVRRVVDNKEEWTYNNFNLVLDIDGEKVVNKRFTKPFVPNIDSTYHKQALIQYDNAAKAFETVKATDPKNAQNLTLLLQAYVKSDRIKEAIQTFRIAVANEPNNKNNHYILGILLRTDGQFQQAIEEFKVALSLDPNYSDALYDIGATQYNWGVDMLKEAVAKDDTSQAYKQKFRDALPYLEKVSTAKKDDPMVFETLGTIYARLGQSDKAMKVLDESDWLRKHYNLKLGMRQADLESDMGQPTRKEDTTFDNKPASKWTYDKEAVSFTIADGVVKDWVRAGK